MEVQRMSEWTMEGRAVFVDGELIGLFKTTRQMQEFYARLGFQIDLMGGTRGPAMYEEQAQEEFVLQVMRNLHKKHPAIPREDLTRAACRTYRGINGRELDRILERLLEKGYIFARPDVRMSKGVRSRVRIRRLYWVTVSTIKDDLAGKSVRNKTKGSDVSYWTKDNDPQYNQISITGR